MGLIYQKERRLKKQKPPRREESWALKEGMAGAGAGGNGNGGYWRGCGGCGSGVHLCVQCAQ